MGAPPEDEGDRVTKSPGVEGSFRPGTSRKEHKVRKPTRDWEASASEATREGERAVLAEHSTEEGGEPRPKGPTGGKATPGIPFDWEERGEILRDHQPSQRNGFVASFHLRDVPLCCSTDFEVEERRHDRL